jgi:hypothetical protein
MIGVVLWEAAVFETRTGSSGRTIRTGGSNSILQTCDEQENDIDHDSSHLLPCDDEFQAIREVIGVAFLEGAAFGTRTG